MRRVLRLVMLCLLFGLAAHWSWRLELLCRREIYHGLEATGVITRTGNFWGQIMGRNIPLHPAWMTAGVRGLGTLGVLPALVLALGAHLAMSTSWRALRGVKARRLALVGGLAAWGAYALAVGLVETRLDRLVQGGAFEIGKFAGCGYFASGEIGVGPDGPFMTGRWATGCNLLWAYGPHVVVSLSAFACALAVFHAFVRRIRRLQRLGICRKCGYSLTGLRADSCPECGESVAELSRTTP